MNVKGKGVFDMEQLYKDMKYWLEYQGYGDENKSFREAQFGQRIKGDSQQIEIIWNCEKKMNDYVSYFIKVTFFIGGLKDVEVEMDGKKVGLNKGEADIRITAQVILDSKDKWKNKFFQKMYNEFIIKDRIESHKTDLYNKVYSFQGEIKAFFDMYGA